MLDYDIKIAKETTPMPPDPPSYPVAHVFASLASPLHLHRYQKVRCTRLAHPPIHYRRSCAKHPVSPHPYRWHQRTPKFNKGRVCWCGGVVVVIAGVGGVAAVCIGVGVTATTAAVRGVVGGCSGCVWWLLLCVKGLSMCRW